MLLQESHYLSAEIVVINRQSEGWGFKSLRARHGFYLAHFFDVSKNLKSPKCLHDLEALIVGFRPGVKLSPLRSGQ